MHIALVAPESDFLGFPCFVPPAIAAGAENYYVLEANKWTVREGSLDLEFALNQIVEKYGRGVYTIRLIAERDDGYAYELTTYSIFKE